MLANLESIESKTELVEENDTNATMFHPKDEIPEKEGHEAKEISESFQDSETKKPWKTLKQILRKW